MRVLCFTFVLAALVAALRTGAAEMPAAPVEWIRDVPEAGIERIRALPAEQQGDAAWRAGAYWIEQKEFGYAERYLAFAETLPFDARKGDLAGRVECLRGEIAYAGGDVEGALRRFRGASELLSGPGREEVLLTVLARQAGVEHGHGRLADASQTLSRVIDLAESRGDRLSVGRYACERGMVLFKAGRLEEADWAAARAREIFADLKFMSGLAECDKLSGNLCSARGEAEKALAYYEAAFAVFKATGNHLESANCRLNASMIHVKDGRDARVEEYLDEAILLYTRAGSVGGVGLCYQNRGGMALQAGDYLKAEKALRTAEKIFTETQNLHRLAQAKQALGELYKRRGDVGKAVDYLTEADRLLDTVANRH